jgi:hypothetical protein
MSEGSGSPSIQAAASGLTLTNSSTSLIQGAGVIGNTGGLILANNGTVNANSSGQTLFLDSNANGGVTNTGLLEATNKGTLQISTVINNAGGNITANGGAVLSNSTIQGGTLNTLGGGTMGTNPGFNSTLDGSTHGALTISAGSTYTNGNASNLITLGNIINNGNIQVAAGSNNSFLFLNNNTTLNGNGTVTLSTTGGGSAIILQENGPLLTLTNASNTIQGAGMIEGPGGPLTVNNQAAGTINANVNGQTLFVNGIGTLTNAGTLEASGGGKLLVSSPFASAANGGFTSATGTLTGHYIVDGSAGHLSTLQINALGSLGNEVTTLGNGTLASGITLNGTNANTVFTDSSGTKNVLNLGTVTGNASLTVEGGYKMTTAALSNAGNVTVGNNSSLTVTTSYSNSGNTVVDGLLSSTNYNDNAGTTTINRGGVLDATGTYTENGGFTDIAVGGTLTAGAVNLKTGKMRVNGTLDPPAIDIFAGTEMFGAGTIVGDVTNNGEIFPGDDPTPGTLAITGSYEETNTGLFMEDIGGTAASPMVGLLAVSGNVALDAGATLDIGSLAFTDATFGQLFTILTFTGTERGTFTNVIGADSSDFDVIYGNPGEIQLRWNQGGGGGGATPEPKFVLMDLALVGILVAWKLKRDRKNLATNEHE